MQALSVRPVGPAPARVMIVGEFPGESEIAANEAFRGYGAQELVRMMNEAGLRFSDCYATYAITERPPRNDTSYFIAKAKKHITPDHVPYQMKWVMPIVISSAKILARQIELVRPRVIIALGDMALFLLTGHKSVTKWRGSELTLSPELGVTHNCVVIPTYAPGLIMKAWGWRHVAVQDLRRAASWQHCEEYIPMNYNFILNRNYLQTRACLFQLYDRLQRGPYKLSVDIETRAGHIACIGIAWSSTDAICIPLMCVARPQGYWTEDEEVNICHLLEKVLKHKNVEVVGQNFAYDIQYFYRHLCWMPNLKRDTMLGQNTLFAGERKSLDFQASMYCARYTYWKDEGKEWDKSMPEERLWAYNCMDACATYEIDTVHAQLVEATKSHSVYNFQQELFWAVIKSTNRGLRVNVQAKGAIAFALMQAIDAHKQWIFDVFGYELNINSSDQMKDLFYRQFGFKPIKDQKTRQVTCSSAALQQLKEREPLLTPITNRIDDLRSLYVFMRTFINAKEDVDGRCRCYYNIAGTETHRFSSSKNAFGSGLNLQNIPKGGELLTTDIALPNVRKLFLPDPGMEMFDIDLSAADLRIVVWEADEQEMKQMLREGLDPYTEIAKEFYRDPSINKKDPRRQKFKSFAHGTNYLGSAKNLALRLGLSVHEAETTQRWYLSRFHRIKEWQDDFKAQVLSRRFVTNVFGYRIFCFERIEGTVFNQLIAWLPQSTVACIINRGYLRLHQYHPEIEVLLQVHDSLGGQYPISIAEQARKTIIDACSIELPYKDPLTVPVGIATSPVSWGDCK